MTEQEKNKLTKLFEELWEVPSDERESEIIEEINKISPDPKWSEYIYWSEEFVNEDESLNIPKLIKKLDEHKPIIFYGTENGLTKKEDNRKV